MATYNGERYLRQQIDSILAQKGVEVILTVRDDGSTDTTCDILKAYSDKGCLKWYRGNNVGPAQNFMLLLQEAEDADYYAFSDQDDYWESDKLLAAVNQLEEAQNDLALYFSQTCLADEALHPLPHQIHIRPLLTYGESLVYQFIGGCTMVLTHALREAVNRYKPQTLYMHDVWIYCVCLAIGGKAFFDAKPHIYYRQHAQNVVGQGNRRNEWKRRVGRIAHLEQARYKTALELIEGYANEMPASNLALTQDFIKAKHNLLARLRLLCDKRLATSSPATSRRFRLALLMGIY
ncbi:MAG: glycosyltransferase [Bacteroidaceae bacterium]|nr:glycosyltransferase [Bacteroidaceae bacterium]